MTKYVTVDIPAAVKASVVDHRAEMLEIFPKGERFVHQTPLQLLRIATVLVTVNMILLAAATFVLLAG